MSGEPGLREVRQAHRFDEAALDGHLSKHLKGYSGPPTVRQFKSGQSNPTFRLDAGDRSYVLRKKPPGKLLPSAHAVEREYRVYSALAETDVPVPRVHLLCEDPSIIGTPFYVMDYVDGRVFNDAMLTNLTPDDRKAVYSDMNRVLAALHMVDHEKKGLSDYGKPGNYFGRQIGRWTKQYVAAKTHDIASMDALIEWLPANMPHDDTTTIVHGDFQLYNLMYHPTEPRVLAILDWELSTLGHPMADLAYNCMKYHQPGQGGSLVNHPSNSDTGIPSEDEFVADYCERTGKQRIDNWNFYLAFSFFRLASIIQGVYKRGLQGNASSEAATGMKDLVDYTANTGWGLVKD